MKYLLLVCWDSERMNAQTEPDPNDPPAENEEGFPWVDDLEARGIWLTGDQLAPPWRARSVRVRGGRKLVTDGPFIETKEAIRRLRPPGVREPRGGGRHRRDAPARRDRDDRGAAALGELSRALA
ncbi:MAG: YciI family protein [Gaiellaceae bacterium]